MSSVLSIAVGDCVLGPWQWSAQLPSLQGALSCLAPPKLRPTGGARMQASFRLRILDGGPVDAFVGFFDVQFRGSPENPAQMEVLLSTAPDATGATHWGQQVNLVRGLRSRCLGGDAAAASTLYCA
jgi:hypothetical protein